MSDTKSAPAASASGAAAHDAGARRACDSTAPDAKGPLGSHAVTDLTELKTAVAALSDSWIRWMYRCGFKIRGTEKVISARTDDPDHPVVLEADQVCAMRGDTGSKLFPSFEPWINTEKFYVMLIIPLVQSERVVIFSVPYSLGAPGTATAADIRRAVV